MYDYNLLAKTHLDHLRKSNTKKERFQARLHVDFSNEDIFTSVCSH